MSDSRMQNRNVLESCGCRKDPLSGLALAMAYVPWQCWNQTYELEKALMCGTIFPELDKPFLGRRGVRR